MATATFAEEVKRKTREELVEALFEAQLELRILMAQKSGEHVPQRLAFATENFKRKLDSKAREDILLLYSQTCKKLDNMEKAGDSEPPHSKAREDILLLYSQACEKLRNMEKAEDSELPPQKKRKPDDEDVMDRADTEGRARYRSCQIVEAGPEDSELPPQKKRKPDDEGVMDRVRYRSCLIPKAGPAVPQLTVRFDSAIEKRLQPILVQCVSQARSLLEQCKNFETLKGWLKFPPHQFPQWEDDFYITWGDEGELAIYVHEVGPDCYSQGKCVAVIRKTEDETASSSSSS
jgi:hypothetical protein